MHRDIDTQIARIETPLGVLVPYYCLCDLYLEQNRISIISIDLVRFSFFLKVFLRKTRVSLTAAALEALLSFTKENLEKNRESHQISKINDF